MKCTNCGSEVAANQTCPHCGAAPTFDAPLPPPIPPQYVTEAKIPLNYKPLSPWAYYGFQLLFSIPVVGFICLIVFSLDDSNINRRNFARSYWCGLIIFLAFVAVVIALLVATGLSAVILDNL